MGSTQRFSGPEAGNIFLHPKIMRKGATAVRQAPAVIERDLQDLVSHVAADRAKVAQWLDQLAKATGDRAFSVAARALRPGTPGRHAIDDELALEEMALLIAEGQTVEEAARAVAITRPCHSQMAATKRLARKYRSREQNSGQLNASLSASVLPNNQKVDFRDSE